ncbi:MAG: hypothetical protein ACTSUK_04020 [Promethearchaeota archaeon]
MKYTHSYPKLKKEKYTTIRRRKFADVGDIVLERYPDGQHHAIITKIEKKSFNEIPTLLLLEDTNTKSREEAYDLLNSFYRKPIDKNEKLYIYHLKKI